jgi:hypothetical protein
MDWFFSIDRDSSDEFMIAARVAVRTARRFAPELRPMLIWNGYADADICQWMMANGCRVRMTRGELSADIARECQALGRPDLLPSVRGSCLKLEVPRLMTGEIALYTDADVMFTGNPIPHIPAVPFMGVVREGWWQCADNLQHNAGVIVWGDGARDRMDGLFDYMRAHLREHILATWDQSAMQAHFGPTAWTWLPNRLNLDASGEGEADIIHFRGPKPWERGMALGGIKATLQTREWEARCAEWMEWMTTSWDL